MSDAKPYSDAELVALGLEPTEDEIEEQKAALRTEALELEAKGALLAAHYVRKELAAL